MKKILLGIIGIALMGQSALSQCTISAIANPNPIVCGESVVLTAFGSSTGSLVLDEDFNSSGFGPGWSSTPGAVSFTNPCSPGGVDGTPHAWMDNNTSVPRALISAPYDLSAATAGVTVCFDMMFATQGDAAPCEGPDEPDEGVYLQYSTDGGATWITINYFDPNGGNDPQLTSWNNYCFALPPGAITGNTMIQWFQSADSGADYDHWGVDNVQIFVNDLNAEVVWLHDGYSYGVGSGGGDNPTAVTPTVTTTYTAQITTGTGQVCTQDVTVVVNSPVFDVNMTASPLTVCVGNCSTITGTAQIIQDPGGIETYENNEFELVASGSAAVNINVQGINTNSIYSGLIQNVTINGFDFSGSSLCTSFGGCNCGSSTVNFGETCDLGPESFTVTLTSPGGCTIILAPAGVANGNYSNTVFVPVGGTAFNGTFPNGGTWDPQEPFANLNGCDPNGVWTLSFDAPGLGFGIGTLFGWSITFDDPPIYQPVCTTWSPTAGLSNPMGLITDACPATSTDYVLTVDNCTPGCPTYTETFSIVVDPCTCTPPNLIITPQQACNPLTVDLSSAIGAASDPATLTYYATQLDAQNGTNPIGVNVSTSGSYWVRAEDPADPTCFMEYEIVVTIDVVTYVAVNSDENCGAADGQIVLNVTPAMGTYDFSIDGGGNSQSGNTFTGLTAGSYSIIITNTTTGCSVTGTEVLVNIGGPTINSITPTNPTCNGDCDGSITVNVSGGNPPYTYTWYDAMLNVVGTNSATITGLCAGSYSVDVTDAAGGSTQLFYDDFESGAAGWNLSSVQGAQGADPNFFAVNDNEGGVAAGGCGVGGNGDQTLHITSAFNPTGGAAYDAGGLCGLLFCPLTSVQAESPLINTVGQTGLTLNFDFIAGGDGTNDQATVWYNCGAGWTQLGALFSGTAGCAGQGLWTAYSSPLPPLCEGIANLQVAIRWDNNDDGAGTDPSVAINNIEVVTSGAAGCLVSQTSTLVEPALVDPTFVLTDFCVGSANAATGIVTAGGTFAFNPLPGDGATINTATGEITGGVAGTQYSVEYTTAAPCSESLIQTVNVNGLTYSSVITDETCGAADGQIVLTANPAGTYTYSIDGGGNSQAGGTFAGLTASTYNVIITDPATGCTATGTETVANIGGATIDLITPSDANCNGVCDGSISVTASGGTGPLNYQWLDGLGAAIGTNSNSITGLCAGNYSVEVTNNNGTCLVTAMATINEPALVDPTFILTDFCVGSANAATGIVTAGGTFAFNPLPGDGATINTATGEITGGVAGTQYSVEYTTAAPCSESLIQTVNVNGFTYTSVITDETCGAADGQVVLTANPAGTYTYSIDGGGNSQAGGTFAGLTASIYNVIITDPATGCTATGTETVANIGGATIDLITPSDANCNGDCDGTISVTASGGTGPLNYQWLDGLGAAIGTNSNSITALCAGNYSVEVTNNNGTCLVTAMATINEPALVDPTFILTDFCVGSANAATGIVTAGGTFSFNPLPGDGATINTATGEITGGIAGTQYSVEYITAAPCSESLIQTVNVNALPNPIITGALSYCIGGNSALDAGAGFTNYNWSTGDATQSITVLAQTGITVTVTDANGCVATSAPVDVIESTTIVTNDIITICQGGSAVIHGNTETVAATYSQTFTSGSGCDSIANVDLVVNPLPTPVITGSLSYCQGGNVTLDAGGPFVNYTWSIGGSAQTVTTTAATGITVTVEDVNNCFGTSSSVDVIELLPVVTNSTVNICQGGSTMIFGNSESVAGLYTQIYVADNGCDSTSNVTLVVDNNPVIDVTNFTEESCLGDNDGTIDVVSVINGSGNYSYSWDIIPDPATASVNSLSPGTYTVTVTDINTTCQVTGATTLNAAAICCDVVIDTTSTTSPSCGQATGVIVATATGGDGVYMYSIDGGPFVASGTFNGLVAGSYQITVQDGSGVCNDVMDVVLVDLLAPTISSITATNLLCNNDNTGTITVVATGGTGILTYTATVGGTSINNTTGSFTGLVAGNYAITVTDENTCSVTGNAVVTEPTIVTIATNPTNVDCFGASTGAIEVIGGGGTPTYSYSIDNGATWSLGNTFTSLTAQNYNVIVRDDNNCLSTVTITPITEPTQVSVVVNGVDEVCFNACDGELSWVANGGTAPYTFSYNGTNTTSSPVFNLCPNNFNYTLTDDLGCSVSGSQVIAPAVEIIPGNITVVDDGCEENCSGEVTVTSNTGVNYTLNGVSDPNGIFTGVCSGVYTIDISDANNCLATANVVVGTMPQTDASFTMSSTTITTIDNEIEFINNSTNASVYIWTISGPDGYSETFNEEDINHVFPTDTGSYLICLTAINPTGCTDVVCRRISVQEGEVLYVPNTFTPDGDEFNQTFRAYASGIDIYDYEMLIFNRWGEVIWETHDVSVGWDGTFHGRMVQDGLYNWKITFKDLYDDDRKTHYGHVNIMR